ncbi:hypothetical protein [Methylophaga thalassica]|uniref:hypothetical protein n=1 Tax=Methylophaga aminisulfidivorans TaxID=230105 RepID=UPI003A907313
MTHFAEPTETEIARAKLPHDIFLSNLIGNHILVFTAISTFGPTYMKYLFLVPLISFLALGYTYWRSSRVKREEGEFVWAHWQVARRWSRFFLMILILLVSVSTLGVLGHMHLGMMKEAVYAMIGGLGILPTLVSVLVLIVIESDSLHHARMGTLPKWALKRFLNIDSAPSQDD